MICFKEVRNYLFSLLLTTNYLLLTHMSQDRLLRLKCGVCKSANYYTSKNKKLVTKKLALNKFCKTCRKKTKHKETKITG